ncbi:OmpA family protein [Turneriella parva]|uniref:OmpA/MotB domain protein n=1 Tax=Turneriella parva (strain ATCC BAA-1111 / DSM 21527 / NCTC 11395 / H) TaxID=869212 RepID=I4B2F3_TURPD|nr:OmpA family protein [Turneriella parva]AFM11460.1 OmpA/MotB domain protein [Turneriella parva DSM 21527]
MSLHKKYLLIALIGTLSASGCVERAEFDREYGPERTLVRDQFVGSIYFGTASSSLSKAANADLARMAARIGERRNLGTRVVLIGYADRKRGVEENSELAAERAQRVAIALEKRGVELERIIIDSRPVRVTRAKEAERRVDIYLDGTAAARPGSLYPILVAFFLLVTFVLAAIIFRRRR